MAIYYLLSLRTFWFLFLINLFRIPADMNYFEVVISSVMFQFSLYAGIRLAHRGFTFGELGLVCFGATVLFMESINLTIARVRYSLNFISDVP